MIECKRPLGSAQPPGAFSASACSASASVFSFFFFLSSFLFLATPMPADIWTHAAHRSCRFCEQTCCCSRASATRILSVYRRTTAQSRFACQLIRSAAVRPSIRRFSCNLTASKQVDSILVALNSISLVSCLIFGRATMQAEIHSHTGGFPARFSASCAQFSFSAAFRCSFISP